MIKELIHDPFFLSIKSTDATKDDVYISKDLIDTITAHKDTCVGMAANMIGYSKRIIVYADGMNYSVMFNPEIIAKSGEYKTEEGCLSLLGGPRPCTRYKTIKVKWRTSDMAFRIKKFEGFTAQIIQHEIDHCNGILI